MNRLLLFVFVVCSACEVPELAHGEAERVAQIRQAGWERQGWERQGWERQGWERQGTEIGVNAIKGFSLKSLVRNRSLADFAELHQGTLRVLESPTITSPNFDDCPWPVNGLARGCSWTLAGVGACTPGTTVEAYDNGSAGSADNMLRACNGWNMCGGSDWMLLASNDDYYGLRPRVAFTCPSSGQFLLAGASYNSAVPLQLSVTVNGATNYPVRQDRPLQNVEFSAVDFNGNTVPARIVDSFPEISSAKLQDAGVNPGAGQYSFQTLRYQVQLRNPDSGAWEDLCAGDYEDDSGAVRNVALATPGWWDDRATRSDDSDLFTFSCQRGVITKCYRWGYHPREGAWNGDHLDRLQTCTRLARADYCGDGRSWTKRGTKINIYDDYGIQSRGGGGGTDAEVEASEALEGISFEAGWLPNGATCLSHTRWSDTPPWVNTTECAQLFNRSTVPGAAPTPRECNSAQEARNMNSNTKMFDDSSTNDAGVDGGN